MATTIGPNGNADFIAGAVGPRRILKIVSFIGVGAGDTGRTIYHQMFKAKFVTVLLDVDVCPSDAGCNAKTRLGVLPKGTQGVTLVERKDPWYHVKWPAGNGWVYSGPGYQSLKLP